jgi:hypothetical protein
MAHIPSIGQSNFSKFAGIITTSFYSVNGRMSIKMKNGIDLPADQSGLFFQLLLSML